MSLIIFLSDSLADSCARPSMAEKQSPPKSPNSFLWQSLLWDTQTPWDLNGKSSSLENGKEKGLFGYSYFWKTTAHFGIFRWKGIVQVPSLICFINVGQGPVLTPLPPDSDLSLQCVTSLWPTAVTDSYPRTHKGEEALFITTKERDFFFF